MALTKISGEVIQSGTPITIGVVTATSINVGSAVTIHTGGYLVGNTDLHSTGITVDNVNVSGISTLGSTVVGGATTQVVVTGDIRATGDVSALTANITSLTASANSGFHVDGSAPASSFLLGNTGNLSLGNDFTVSGNAGIGTDTPTESFEVNGGDIKLRTTSFAGFTTTRRLYALGGSGTYNLGLSGGSAIAFIRDGNNNDAIAFETHAQGSSHTEVLRITSNSRIGIGTTNPNSRLQVSGDGVPVIINSTNNNDAKISLQSLGVTSCYLAAGGGNIFEVKDANSNDCIAVDGKADGVGGQIGNRNVSIGTNGANNIKLYVYNTDTGYAGFFQSNGSRAVYGVVATIQNGTGSGYGVYGYSQTSSTYATGGVLGYSINSSTYGILGYWSGSSYWSLYGNGSIYIGGSYQGSDERLKDIVEPLVGVGSSVRVLDKLSNISAVKYRWKEGSQQRRAMGDNVNIGLIAQEVEEYFPELIKEVDNPVITGVNPETLNEQIGRTKSLQYNNMVAVLLEAIKELKADNEALAARIALLENP